MASRRTRKVRKTREVDSVGLWLIKFAVGAVSIVAATWVHSVPLAWMLGYSVGVFVLSIHSVRETVNGE